MHMNLLNWIFVTL